VERPVTEYLERLFQPYGVQVVRESCSPQHENLAIYVPGRTPEPWTLLESHMDTVPADDWADRAFVPRADNGRIFGRGACDDKGPLTSMVLAVLDLLESGESPPVGVCLLAAGDEEYAQTGIKHFARATRVSFGRGVFGEPTRCLPVIQHKGTVRWDILVHGKSAHTSRPELGTPSE
jgi:acetylornithine deacetylase